MLHAVINKETFEALDGPLKELYKPQGAGFALSITGVDDHPDVAALRKTRDELLEEKRKVQGAASEEANELRRQLEEHEARERKAMEEQGKYKDLYEQATAKQRENDEAWRLKYDRLQAKNDDQALNGKARELAVSLGGADCAEGLLPHIERRLKMFDTDDGRVLKICDAVGNATDLTLDDLGAELKQLSHLKPLIRGPGSGGGGAGPTDKGGGTGKHYNGDWEKYFDPNSADYNATEQGKLYHLDREQFTALKRKYG